MKKVYALLLIAFGMIAWVGCSDNSQENVQKITKEPTKDMMARVDSTGTWNISFDINTARFVTDVKVTFDTSKTADKLPTGAYQLTGAELEDWVQYLDDYNNSSYKFDPTAPKYRCVAVRGFTSADYGGTLWQSSCGKFHVYCNGRWYAYPISAATPSYGTSALNVLWTLETACGTYSWWNSN